MQYIKTKIKEQINLHLIKTDKFKTDLIAVIFTMPITLENATKNTLVPTVLRRGSRNIPTQEELNKRLENLYGAEFDCGVEKVGDNQVLKFYIESINQNYVLNNENILKETTNILFDLIFNPFIENNVFKEEYVLQEKDNIKQIIESKKDNKDKYSIERLTEEMYKDKPYGIYKYGYSESLEKIDNKNLYEHYINLIKTSKIDIFISGDIEENIKDIIIENENIKKLNQREMNFIINNEETEVKEEIKDINIVEEKLEVTQGKLAIGLDIKENNKDSRYAMAIYNTILGASANSKLFQNVREKESLAYTVGSLYVKQKNNIIIKAGIEIEKYEAALNIIKKQLEDMKNGKFDETDLENAKRYMIYAIREIESEQEIGIIYYLGQELAGTRGDIEEYIEKINNITKEDVINIAKKVEINTIYFLKG